MGNNITEKGRMMAALKAEKRAAALRENLRRRKETGAGNRPEPPKGMIYDTATQNRDE